MVSCLGQRTDRIGSGMSSNLNTCRFCVKMASESWGCASEMSHIFVHKCGGTVMDQHRPPIEAFTKAFLSLHQNGGLSRHPFCPCTVSYAQLHAHESSCAISWFLSAFPTQARDDAHRTGTTEWVGDRIPLTSLPITEWVSDTAPGLPPS
jgi:hypothetical protein